MQAAELGYISPGCLCVRATEITTEARHPGLPLLWEHTGYSFPCVGLGPLRAMKRLLVPGWVFGSARPCGGCPTAGREVKDLQGQGTGAPQQRRQWQCQSKQRVQVRFTVKGKTNY